MLQKKKKAWLFQIRREASLSISEQISKLGELPSSSELPMQVEAVKAERIAADRLKELWTEQLRSVIRLVEKQLRSKSSN